MGVKKAIRQVCVTALFVALGTVTALAANAGQASGTNVNVRTEADKSADVLGKIDKGTEYEILDKDGSWFEISYNGRSGYVSKDYFEVTKADANIDGSSVNCRESASTSAASLGKFANGDYVCVTGQNDSWYRISHRHRIHSLCLHMQSRFYKKYDTSCHSDLLHKRSHRLQICQEKPQM